MSEVKIRCFNCKEHKIITLSEGSVQKTSNDRRVVKSVCPDCSRPLTSLINTELGNKFLKPSTENDRPQESDQPA